MPPSAPPPETPSPPAPDTSALPPTLSPSLEGVEGGSSVGDSDVGDSSGKADGEGDGEGDIGGGDSGGEDIGGGDSGGDSGGGSDEWDDRICNIVSETTPDYGKSVGDTLLFSTTVASVRRHKEDEFGNATAEMFLNDGDYTMYRAQRGFPGCTAHNMVNTGTFDEETSWVDNTPDEERPFWMPSRLVDTSNNLIGNSTTPSSVTMMVQFVVDPAGVPETSAGTPLSATVNLTTGTYSLSMSVEFEVTATTSANGSAWGNHETSCWRSDGKGLAPQPVSMRLLDDVRLDFTACDVEGLPVAHHVPLLTRSDGNRHFEATLTNGSVTIQQDVSALSSGGMYTVSVQPSTIGNFTLWLFLVDDDTGRTTAVHDSVPVEARCPSYLVQIGVDSCGCPAGQYDRGGEGESCSACPSGQSSTDGAMYNCEDCPAGYVSSPETGLCEACAEGTFAPSAGLGMCISCEVGTYSAAGATSCEPCGEFSSMERTVDLSATVPESPFGVNCTRSILHGTLAGHWTNGVIDALNGNSTRVWACVPIEACVGGLDSACAVGYEGPMCAACARGFIRTRKEGPCEPHDFNDARADTMVAVAIVVSLLLSGALGCCCVGCCWRLTRQKPPKPRPPWEEEVPDDDLAEESIDGRAGNHGGDARTVHVKSSPPTYHVWVHRAVDAQLAPFAFHEMVTKELGAFGIHAQPELESRAHREHDHGLSDEPARGPSAAVRHDPMEHLSGAHVCVFLLSNSVFHDERSLALLRHAVELGKQCILVNMPEARFPTAPGKPCDRPFPENTFNPTWTPHCPEFKPAFAEICITWELEYPQACCQELLRRVASHLERLTGAPVCDVAEAMESLQRDEGATLRAAIDLKPSEVDLAWEWEAKVWDAFLSHKITDAKDVVLTWHTALSALGYNPFIDRINLDAVENIPKFVEQTASFVIAVTANLWQSYWCAVELCKAVTLHAEGKLNILLIPIQGERYTAPGDEAPSFDFPTPAIMMQNFEKWFPEADAVATAGIERLYGGGEYTHSRLVKHTLMHYKSFERLLFARVGLSIRSHIELAALIEEGGADMESRMAAVQMLVDEANAYEQQRNSTTRYELAIEQVTTALGHGSMHDTHLTVLEVRRPKPNKQELRPGNETGNAEGSKPTAVVGTKRMLRGHTKFLQSIRRRNAAETKFWAHRRKELDKKDAGTPGVAPTPAAAPAKAPTKPRSEKEKKPAGTVKSYHPDEFSAVVVALRAESASLGSAMGGLGLAAEMTLSSSQSGAEPLKALGGVLGECQKVLIGFFQISASIAIDFPSVPFPKDFLKLTDVFSVLMGDFISGDGLNELIDGRLHFANTTIFACVVLLVFCCSIPAAHALLSRCCYATAPASRRVEAADSCVRMVVFLTFLAYPIVSARLLKLYHLRSFGDDVELLDADFSLTKDDLGTWQASGALFLVLYTVGIPATFFCVLWNTARKQADALDLKTAEGVAAARQAKRYLARYGLLYAKYEIRCWWWEMVELLRKLLLTGVVVFVVPGSVTQIWFAIVVSLVSLLTMTFFTPYANAQIDAISWVAQTCTLFSLLSTLALKVGFDTADKPLQHLVTFTIVVAQILPVLACLLLVGNAMRDIQRASAAAHRRMRMERERERQQDEPPTAESPPLAEPMTTSVV